MTWREFRIQYPRNSDAQVVDEIRSRSRRRTMTKVWSKPEIAEEDVGMEVTSYESADIDIEI